MEGQDLLRGVWRFDRVTVRKNRNEATPANLDPRFAEVAEAFGDNPLVEQGTMMSSYGLTVNGKIFAMFGRDQFIVKLPRERVDQLVASRKGTRFDPRRNGRVMKEWIAMSAGEAEWIPLAREAYQFVKSAAKKKPAREGKRV